MRETERIAGLFTAFYEGDCWIGLNFKHAVKGIDVEMATQKNVKDHNSIWQLVNHMIYWRKTVIIRLQGVLGNPPMNDFYEPANPTAENWKETLEHFEEVHQALIENIEKLKDDQLEQPSPMKGQTYYQLLMGCLQHDSYHMGQLILLKKG